MFTALMIGGTLGFVVQALADDAETDALIATIVLVIYLQIVQAF